MSLFTTVANAAISAFGDIKRAAINAYNNAISVAKKKFLSIAQDKLDELDNMLTAAVAAKFGPIISKLSSIKSQIISAKESYIAARKVAKKIKDAVTAHAEDVAEELEEAEKAILKESSNVPVDDVEIGEVAKKEILATVDPEVTTKRTLGSDDIDLYLQFKNAKIKLNSIDELVAAATDINNHLDREGAASARAWVHKVLHTHPLVDDKIKDLGYFKPISNEVGVTYLRHTPDTQTLALQDWSKDIAKPFRRSLEHKMDESYETINGTYESLNSMMARNISTEFYYERGEDYATALKDQGNNYLNKELLSNDYHIAGDYTFRSIHVNALHASLLKALVDNVGSEKKLINWLYPVSNYDTALCGGLTINIEGNEVKVNLKGDKIGTIATVIDKTPISALECK
jgi:hypothetical protein